VTFEVGTFLTHWSPALGAGDSIPGTFEVGTVFTHWSLALGAGDSVPGKFEVRKEVPKCAAAPARAPELAAQGGLCHQTLLL